MEYKNNNEIIKKMMLSYSSVVSLISKAMENNECSGKKCLGLSKVQFGLLQLINSLDKPTLSMLVNATGTSKSSTSLTLTKMENDGYIKRVPSDNDKRIMYIVLTEKGKEVYDYAANNFVSKLDEFYNKLNEENKILFGNIIENSYKLFVENKEAIKRWN